MTSKAQLSKTRRSLKSERLTLQRKKSSQHSSKKQKPSYIGESPPAFWDTLSKNHLTKLALKELNRKNIQTASNPILADLQPQRSITRHVLADSNRSSQPIIHAVDYLYRCTTEDLSTIRQTARQGGPDLSELRDFPEPSYLHDQAINSRFRSGIPNSEPVLDTISESSMRTKTTGPYNGEFQQSLIDGGVYPIRYTYLDGRMVPKPGNLKEINRRLSKPRPSLTSENFSEGAYDNFLEESVRAKNESQVLQSVIPIIEGKRGKNKSVSGSIPFTNLDPLIEKHITPGSPDIYYGAPPEMISPQVRENLSGHIIPSKHTNLPSAPNFFLEAKGPDGSASVAGLQASHTGALGARGIHSLQSYGQDAPKFDNKAYTITSTYHDGHLQMYTSHPTQPRNPGCQPEYVTNRLSSWSMNNGVKHFREGATGYRNARDWAEEQRNMAINHANAEEEKRQAGTYGKQGGKRGAQ